MLRLRSRFQAKCSEAKSGFREAMAAPTKLASLWAVWATRAGIRFRQSCGRFGWEMPERVIATATNLNKVDTIISCVGTALFSGGRWGSFDCGVESPHRSQYEVTCEKGVIKVDDLVGGQDRSGDFGAYEGPFVGSDRYVQGDVMGKDEVVKVEACDHVNRLVEDMVACVRSIKAGGEPDLSWPRRSLAVHAVMSAFFESAQNGGTMVTVKPFKFP